MRSTFIGLLIAPVIIYYALTESIPNMFILFNIIGLLVVAGGTFSAGVMTYGLKELLTLAKISLKVFIKPEEKNEKNIAAIIRVSSFLEKNPDTISTFQGQDIHPFLKDGLRLIENGFSDEQIDEIMNNDVEKRYQRQMAEVELLKTIAKYPPAFGMIGTVIGLIGLLTTLSSEVQVGNNMLGPSMAIALLTTLYGLIFSNYFLVPLSDNLLHRLYYDINLRKMIVEGVILIQQKKDPVFIREYLIVNIKPDKRNEIIMSNF
jgi:chemotaxis protein MotA